MEVTDKIREAFEKWQSEHDPRQYPAERQAFSAGYQAAIASLEQVGFTFEIELKYMRTADPRRGPTAALWPDQGGEDDAIPLYRIATPLPEENAL